MLLLISCMYVIMIGKADEKLDDRSWFSSPVSHLYSSLPGTSCSKLTMLLVDVLC